eukprot:6587275-Prymnesium_polylepis.1
MRDGCGNRGPVFSERSVAARALRGGSRQAGRRSSPTGRASLRLGALRLALRVVQPASERLVEPCSEPARGKDGEKVKGRHRVRTALVAVGHAACERGERGAQRNWRGARGVARRGGVNGV